MGCVRIFNSIQFRILRRAYFYFPIYSTTYSKALNNIRTHPLNTGKISTLLLENPSDIRIVIVGVLIELVLHQNL